MSRPMTRCECHGVPFSEVAEYAAEHPDQSFKQLIRNVGCGQTCTACHCDLKAYLKAHRPADVIAHPAESTPATAAA